MPFERDYTLIGTTDLDYSGDLDAVGPSPAEIEYLCGAASNYFRVPITASQVLWSYSGVRPLYDDGASEAQEATRDYVLKLDESEDSPALLSIFGGKITTYRRLAEAALRHIVALSAPGAPAARMDRPPSVARRGFSYRRFRNSCGQNGGRDILFCRARQFVVWSAPMALASEALLGGAKAQSDLGQTFGADLTEAEVLYLARNEWAMTATDVVWRRSKLGLRMSEAEVEGLDAYLRMALAAPQTSDRKGASVE